MDTTFAALDAATIEPSPRGLAHDPELQRWILLSGAGDRSAFESLYIASAPWLLGLVRRIVGRLHDEDVLAEAYLQVWRTAREFDPLRANARAWLGMIARTRALDRLRRERCAHGGQAWVTDVLHEPTHDDGPDHAMMRRQDRAWVENAMSSSLNSRERMVVVLAYFRDCTQSEIAGLTGMPLGTVKSLMVRSQAKLRRHAEGAWSPSETLRG